ncbi:MAG: AAA family ATPase [Rubrivivax sp.]
MTVTDVHHLVDTARRVPPPVVEAPTTGALKTLDHLIAASLPDDDSQFDDELVEGLLGRAAMAVLYGDSNSGKTFAAIELGARLSLAEEFLGHRTAGGIVVYLATEAAESVLLRLRAWRRRFGIRLPQFVIVRSPVNLFDGDGDTMAAIALIATVDQQLQGKVVLVIGDTLARISAGANENSGEDMGIVLKHADRIRQATGAAFLWVHHTGKDAAKGMRGWSGMRAAIDTEIEVTADEATGLRSMEITKQRDLPGKGDRIGFRLEPVPMGVNRWGAPRTSCVVLASDAPAPKPRGKRVSEIAGAVTELLTQHGAGLLKGRIVAHFDGRYHHSGVYRELKAMVEDGRLIESSGVVALPGKPKS